MGPLMNALNKSDFCYVRIAISPGEQGQESTGQGESCTNINIYSSCLIFRNWNLCDHWLQPVHNLEYMTVYGQSQLFLVECWQAQIYKCVPTLACLHRHGLLVWIFLSQSSCRHYLHICC